MRGVEAQVTIVPGNGKPKKINVPQVEAYSIVQSLDVDTDTFSVDIGDSLRRLDQVLDRDTEVRVALFFTGDDGRKRQVFAGIADNALGNTQHIKSLAGRDTPSVVFDTDAEPGRWRRIKPGPFLTKRARSLGLTNVQIADMKEVKVIFTDGTEKEWAFWYRIARNSGMYMWATNNGKLVVDKIGYSPTKYDYSFGRPPANDRGGKWIPVSDVTIGSNKQSRLYKSLLYGEDAKSGRVRIGRSVDNRIKSWQRKATRTTTTSTIKTQQKMNDEAKIEVFEGLVGAQEHVLIIRDTGIAVERNRMCRVNLPSHGLVGRFFIVGVTRQGGPSSFEQIVRLRERGFGVTKRVPEAPSLDKDTEPEIKNKPVGAISTVLENAGIPYGASFIRAAQEFGVPQGWNLSYYAGVLMAIASIESGFQNLRERGDTEWFPRGSQATTQENDRDAGVRGRLVSDESWQRMFANAKGNPYNPYRGRSASNGEAGVGVMQLTSLGLKEWADQYGWNDRPKKGELEGGRWNPDSNIRAAARYLANICKLIGANPTQPESIWQAVGAYHTGPGGAGGSSAAAYAERARRAFTQFYNSAKNAIQSTQALPAGSAIRSWNVPGHGVINAPDGTPPEVAKAITWGLSKLGTPYLFGGPKNGIEEYDCSSFAVAAYTYTTPALKNVLKGPVPRTYHGDDNTYTLFREGRFAAPSKDNLLPGDWVFFNSLEHMGLYIGDGLFLQSPNSRDVVKVSSLGEGYYVYSYEGARRLIAWPVAGVPKPTAGNVGGTVSSKVRVMIQAGHDPGGHGDQPYGHTGESGPAGELAFTKEIRDHVIGLLSKNPKLEMLKGTAWDASAGETSGVGDDIDIDCDVFVSIHYDKGTAGSGWFMGYTRGATDGRPVSMNQNSVLLASYLRGALDKPGFPPNLTDNTGFGAPSGDPAGASGWGYYAWGSTLRAAPNNVNHLPGVRAALIIECGRADDATFLDNKRAELAKALAEGINLFCGDNL